MWFPLSQVNGVLPILPLLFPVLWVLATACGEARVLAQMSKASPSSLVGFLKASGGRSKKNKKQQQKRESAGPQQTGVGPAPPWAQCVGRPWAVLQASALSFQKHLQATPPGAGDIHPGAQQTGDSGTARCPFPKAPGACRWGPPLASLEASVRGQSPPLRLTPLSVQLAKFSEDTLSSYTEAVSTQVHSRGTNSAQASSGSPGLSLL